MNLIQAFGFTRKDRISFIGSGDKATIIFQIARKFQSPVLVTTTTGIGADEIALADNHIVLDENDHIQAMGLDNFTGITLITGPVTHDDRYGSPNCKELNEICKVSQDNQFLLLVNADDSGKNALFTLGDKKSVIPDFSTCVVNVVDIKNIEELIGGNLSIRSGIPAYGSSLVDEGITATQISTIGLKSKNKDLRNFQDGVVQYLIINGVDTLHHQALAGKLAENLITFYQKIGICQVNPDLQLIARKKSIAAVVLAAGGASRFGKAKQLNIWREKTYTENVVIAAQRAGLSPIVVVTGCHHEDLENVLKAYPVEIVFNPDWQKGQSTSMKVGLERLEKHVQGVIFLMADQPQISISVIRGIMEKAYLTDKEIIGPMIDGKRSTPMYFDRVVFPELVKVEGDQGGRSILSRYQPLLVEWFDTRMGVDIDLVSDINYLTTIE